MNPQDFQREKRATTVGGERDTSPSTTLTISSLVAALAGWGLGMYAGVFLLMPLVASVVILLIARKLLAADKRIILLPLSLQAGQLAWIIAGMLATRTLGAYVIDVVWCLAGLIWLVARPGRGPIWTLAIYQTLGLAINVYFFAHASVQTAPDKALLVHIVWRLLALFYLGRLYVQLQRRSVAAAASEPGEPPQPMAP
jgi:hypothetical protein